MKKGGGEGGGVLYIRLIQWCVGTSRILTCLISEAYVNGGLTSAFM